MLNNLVSVIIPTFNRSKLLKRAIKSVLKQSHSNFQLIIVDDGSTDNTGQIVKEFSDKRIKYILHEKPKHASAARNTGIRNASGDIITFLDDDDWWLPEKTEKQLSLLTKSDSSTGLIYCWMDYVNKDDEIISTIQPNFKGNVFKHVLDKQGIGGCPTLMVRKSAIDTCGLFDEDLLRGNDGDFIRRICLKYKVDFVPEILVKAVTNHGYQRISDNNRFSIEQSLKSYTVRLKKFESSLDEYPVQVSNIYASIAYHHAMLGNLKKIIKYTFKSISTDLMGRYKYRILVKSLKDFIIYNLIKPLD